MFDLEPNYPGRPEFSIQKRSFCMLYVIQPFSCFHIVLLNFSGVDLFISWPTLKWLDRRRNIKKECTLTLSSGCNVMVQFFNRRGLILSRNILRHSSNKYALDTTILKIHMMSYMFWGIYITQFLPNSLFFRR